MKVPRILPLVLVLLAGCAAARNPFESTARKCEMRTGKEAIAACHTAGWARLNGNDRAGARELFARACKLGSCWEFEGTFGHELTVDAAAREVCGHNAACRHDRLRRFANWRAAKEREAVWPAFERAFAERCVDAAAAAASVKQADCEPGMYYVDHDAYLRACSQQDAERTALFADLRRELEQSPDYRGPFVSLGDGGPDTPASSFLERLHGCAPVLALNEQTRVPPRPTKAYVAERSAACKANGGYPERECLRVEMYPQTQLDPRAPMTPEQTAELETRYRQVWGARDQAAAASGANTQTYGGDAYASCMAASAAKAAAWQQRLDSMSRRQKLKLDGQRVDPNVPDSPIIRARLDWEVRRLEWSSLTDTSGRLVRAAGSRDVPHRVLNFWPNASELQARSDAACQR